MATSKVGAVRSALKTLIEARLVTDGITAVDVRKFPPVNDANTTEDRIFLDVAEVSQEHHTFQSGRAEEIALSGKVTVMRSGSSEAEQQATETRALLLLGSIENGVRADPEASSSVFHVEIVDYTVTPQLVVNNQGVATEIEFELSVIAHI